MTYLLVILLFISNTSFSQIKNTQEAHILVENYQSNFLNNYSLIGIDCYEKKIGEVFSIPSESQSINIEKIKFNIGKSDNYIVFEKRNNKIIDIYFLSKKKIDEHNIFFNNDVSSFINLLMSN